MSAHDRAPLEGVVTFGSGDEWLRLRVQSYQFADATDEHDANWLVIAGEVQLDSLRWRFDDPCLLTWELESLMTFLWLAADDPTTPRTITFLEPLLAFTWNGDGTLRIALEGEAKAHARTGGSGSAAPLLLDVACTPDDLLRARSELEFQRRRFPRRAVK